MLVKNILGRNFHTTQGKVGKGETANLEDEEAQALIDLGYAEEADEETPVPVIEEEDDEEEDDQE